MLIKEPVEEREGLVRFYSDDGLKIRKVGTDEYYEEAIEIADTTCEYEETDIPVDVDLDEEYDEVEDMRAALEVLGVKK